jgi:hypothetical protein
LAGFFFCPKNTKIKGFPGVPPGIPRHLHPGQVLRASWFKYGGRLKNSRSFV